ncbi:tudor and KH domain-containing protein [Dryobates pubescens]|uniref:tudor and KH domain-containing protein n=1 Tax=Dryobates pubescens TaxID=118200 RepID=UPI0023B8A7AD|nr:tudor and KH domain-containing protein [Dryobates pubescens]
MPAERSSWSGLSTLQKAAVLLGVPAAAVVCYILYRRYRESREEHLPFVGEEELEMEVRVPQAVTKSIIGRRGVTIKKLRRETGACIEVESQEEGEDTVLLLSGSPEQVAKAKASIQQIVEESRPVSEQLCVPQRAVGRIIGRGGETVRGICRSSGASVQCEREAQAGVAPVRHIQLLGTRSQVAAAKKLILEKLVEDEAFRQELAQAAASRCQRKQPLGGQRQPEPLWDRALEAEEEAKEGSLSWGEQQLLDQAAVEEAEDGSEELPAPGVAVPRFEVPSPDFSFQADEHLEVYVSAAENPNHFWVQLVGQRSLELDKLAAEMSQHYQSCAGHMAELLDVQAGDIVAAPYQDGSSWYRARVLGTLENGNFDLYYVDFGDNGEAPREALRALRSDFLSLPFQAIECSLAGVAPAGDEWEEVALDTFDQLAHCALWKPLVAKISSYAHSRLGTWPNIHLYDPQDGQNLDIGAELVRLGHAVPVPCAQEEDSRALGSSPGVETTAETATVPPVMPNAEALQVMPP